MEDVIRSPRMSNVGIFSYSYTRNEISAASEIAELDTGELSPTTFEKTLNLEILLHKISMKWRVQALLASITHKNTQTKHSCIWKITER